MLRRSGRIVFGDRAMPAGRRQVTNHSSLVPRRGICELKPEPLPLLRVTPVSAIKSRRTASILWVEGVGFSLIIVIAWLSEILDVQHVFFSAPSGINWARPVARTAVILLVWAAVHIATRRLLRRLYYLEDFLLMCAWCRRLGHENRWMNTEEFFGAALATPTTHGVCPDCAQRIVAELETSPAARKAGRPRPQVERR